MVNINTNINDIPGRPRVSPRRPSDRARLTPKQRAFLNEIPSPDLLRSMVENAMDALSAGIYWDRGTIVNLIV
jgi:hypothetical protein